ncbi:6-bladed beta-propeller [Geotalea uraniireducens]|uniref:NHL repeat containing protein n=1 Tax=Geotalea uraniireducens (strain Rf4) TaxID=351605 RepID=A5GFA5_GEOUR|nr:6-bladed beta-propeller [Geotalea uraniireducens]ABQ26110.1 NHL repeat containing protein [Geotalea uraniireducens Rf4]
MYSRLFLVLVFFTIFGCTTVEPLVLRDTKIDLAWPLPPNSPRIRFLRTINGPDNIITAPGKVQHLFEMVTGESRLKVDFDAPYGITGDGESVLYIADTGVGLVHRYDLINREVGYIVQAGDEEMSSPVGVAVDGEKNLYVADSVNAKVYKYNKKGQFLRELKYEAGFKRPAGIAVNSRNEKFIVDVLAHKLYIFGEDDRFIRDFPKMKKGEELNYPSNVAIDRADNVYVTDSMNFTIKVYNREGDLQRTIGQIGDSPGSFARPKGIAVDSDQQIYVVDATLDNFQIFNQKGNLLQLIGKNGGGAGEFYLPSGIYIDKHDRIFVTDTYNRRIQVFQYLKEGGKL